MTYRIKFELLGLPHMANASGKSRHWRVGQQDALRWRAHVAAAVLRSGKPKAPLARAKLTLVRFSSVEPDFDGLVRGMKSVVDGLVISGVLLDDKLSNTGPWNCFWEKAPPKKGRIVVIVESVDEGAN